ncbi:unnamed protein product [Lactuca saligna]|uniref:Uncharacterized protein n=1 Tax=Lactuca saligna TaxID=75948 RepID=A0AA36A220_LACSI|nr:unnamed protein product [Lactuca saligna]
MVSADVVYNDAIHTKIEENHQTKEKKGVEIPEKANEDIVNEQSNDVSNHLLVDSLYAASMLGRGVDLPLIYFKLIDGYCDNMSISKVNLSISNVSFESHTDLHLDSRGNILFHVHIPQLKIINQSWLSLTLTHSRFGYKRHINQEDQEVLDIKEDK